MHVNIESLIKQFMRMGLGVNLMALSHLIRMRPGLFLRACRASFGVAHNMNVRDTEKIPEVGLLNILGDRRPVIRLPVCEYIEGQLSTGEAMVLLALLVAEAPKEVLEIGTFMGYTSRLMAENLENARIHTLDLPIGICLGKEMMSGFQKDDNHLIGNRVVGKEFAERPCADRIIQHYGDSADWNFREAGHPSFFFIDGSHTYEYCKNDSEKCFGMAETGAIILWHDCNDLHPGVVKYLGECCDNNIDIQRISGTSFAYFKQG